MSITSEEFFTLVQKFFKAYEKADVMAILKRCVIMIFKSMPSTSACLARMEQRLFTAFMKMISIRICSPSATRLSTPCTRSVRRNYHPLSCRTWSGSKTFCNGECRRCSTPADRTLPS